ncbi:hypothetical protein ACUODJ_47345, partial [Escherichia sp. HC-CC]
TRIARKIHSLTLSPRFRLHLLVGTLYQLIDQAKRTPVRQFRGIVAPGSGGSADKKKAAPRKRSAKKSPPADEVGSGAIA